MSRRSEIEAPFYLAVAGAMLAYYSYKKIKRKTHMVNTAKQVISAASAGSVEIEAIAWPFRSMDVSLDGKRVVFKRIVIQKLVKRGKNKKWETVWKKSSPNPFLVFDHSGFLTVAPVVNGDDDAMLDGITQKTYEPTNLSQSQLDCFNEFYDHSVQGFNATTKQGFLATFFSFNSAFRILERYVAIGSPLLIHGHLNPEDSFRYINVTQEFALFKERVSKLLKNKDFRRQLFDKNKDGTIDAKELYDGFQSTLKASVKNGILHTDLRQSGLPHEKIYGTILTHTSQELLLSDCFEEQFLAAKPIYWNWLGLYAGIVMVGLGIYFFLNL